ncbi:MAG: PEP/pyruvate-binding domain-containing protein [Nitrospiraceae bacterium]
MIVPIGDCGDPCLVGGKAVGLARLLAAGFLVPSGWCLTVSAYRHYLDAAGIDAQAIWHQLLAATPAECRRRCGELRGVFNQHQWPAELTGAWMSFLGGLPCDPTQRWAVRSSATNEDVVEASAAGLYRTCLGQAFDELPTAIASCWASVWDERVVAYVREKGGTDRFPEMAVVIQPMLDARAAGVAFSHNPVTGARNQVVIDAVPGLGEPLVSGRVSPDRYVVEWSEGRGGKLEQAVSARKDSALRLTAEGVATVPLVGQARHHGTLTESEALELASIVKRAERRFGRAMDVEWAYEGGRLWLVQARPAAEVGASPTGDDGCEWSRANFKETLPDVPSPLGIAFLKEFMEDHIIRCYRSLGCRVPAESSSVRVIEGRPFINVTLLKNVVGQLGGDPRTVVEQMGGRSGAIDFSIELLPAWTRIKAGLMMEWQIRRAARLAPGWFGVLRRQSEEAVREDVAHESLPAILDRLERLGTVLQKGEMTFAIVAGVAQGFQVLGWLLPPLLGEDWRRLLNGALQGQGTVISAAQIRRLAAVTDAARSEPRSLEYFLEEPWNPSTFRERLASTRCLSLFEEFLCDYGHRAVGESDLMTPRFAEAPGYLLNVIRAQLSSPVPLGVDKREGPSGNANDALAEIRRRLGKRLDVWWAFRYWHSRLCRSLALREGNRHALMYFATASRRLLLQAGELLRREDRLSRASDIFFLTTDEVRGLKDHFAKDWRPLVSTRQAERAKHLSRTVSDFVVGDRAVGASTSVNHDDPSTVYGLAISTGCVEGPVRHIRTVEDLELVQPGDILVTSVIDPGMAAVFGVAVGLIAEMGGTLSHGAIIAREYGLPALVNVPYATGLFSDGERVRLDASSGIIRRLVP